MGRLKFAGDKGHGDETIENLRYVLELFSSMHDQ
jgi:hypothetical protein